MNKSITIVIPAHNEARLIRRCLDALAAQTDKPDAVLVIDNNSSDQTAKLAASYPFVRVLHESKQGIVYARNRGFDAALEAGTDIIARIDADSVLPPDWVARVRAFYAPDAGHNELALTGGCRFYNLHFGRFTGFLYGLIVHRSNTLMLGYAFPWGSNMALPAGIWRKTRGETCPGIDVHEDLDLGIHLHRQGFDTHYLPTLQVGAVARRVTSERGKLWPYLRMWTHTLRVHGVWLWPLSAAMGASIWIGTYMLYVLEKLANGLTRRRLDS